MATDTSRDDSASAHPATTTATADSLEVLERVPLTFQVRTRWQIITALSVCCVGYFTTASVLNRLEVFHDWVAIGLGVFWPLVTALFVRRIRRRGSDDGLAS